MKRIARVGALIKILSEYPNHTFGLSYFCEQFGAAKSSISEDIRIARGIVGSIDMGLIETIPGAGGGVRFTPYISDKKCLKIQKQLCTSLTLPDRILGGGFLYTSDIMFNPHLARSMSAIFARKFRDLDVNYVATIETKGIPLAMMTADLLGVPVVVVRRESKISEGPTVSINYFSGSTDRIQKMSLGKKATIPGSKAIIIDDFMRAGGSLKGIVELLGEFNVEVNGIGVAISSVTPKLKKVDKYTPLVYLGDVDESTCEIDVFPNYQIFE